MTFLGLPGPSFPPKDLIKNTIIFIESGFEYLLYRTSFETRTFQTDQLNNTISLHIASFEI